MAENANPVQVIEDWLDVPNRLIGKMDAILANVHVPLPPFGRQLLMLVVLGGLTWFAQKSKGESTEKLKNNALDLVSWFLGVVGGCIVWSWIQFYLLPLPSDKKGVIHLVAAGDGSAQMLFDARVKLLDASGAEIPSSPGRPDTETGVFSIHCKHELGRNPTTLRVDVPNCVTKDYPVTRGQLRHQPELELIVTCANIR